MKAISLWQPWATAVAEGLKKIETRHWSTRYRGPIAIHAAKRWTRGQREFAALRAAAGHMPGEIPFGALVATARLVDCVRTEDLDPDYLELHWGDYAAGRFGWILEDIEKLDEPIPFKGMQGLFNVPDEILG